MIGTHAGEVVELRGDEVLAAFTSARSALRAAVALQDAFTTYRVSHADLPLRAGIGLDAGEAIPVRGGYRGGALNLAARLCSMAAGDEVLASAEVIHLARAVDDLVYVDRGSVRPKGLDTSVQVYQIAAPGVLPITLPPLDTSLAPIATNLPDAATPLIGRQQEIAEVTALLREPAVRLVTLTGPGGSGKTRLSLEVAAALLHEFPEGVFAVELAPIVDAELVPAAIASVLGVHESGASSILDLLATHLRDCRVLLVLDNFEHVIAAAGAIAILLDRCRTLKILVTSRTSLHLSREYEYPVEPLPVPEPGNVPPLDELEGFDAVRLLVDRARATDPRFTLTEANAAAVAGICTRLDGLPLAIQLAASRLRLFPPAALHARLTHSLSVLTGGARDLPARQQTLRGTIAWSYSLLTPAQKRIFAYLSVFAGGATLEAIETVVGSGNIDVLDGIEALLDQSLLRQTGSGEARFSMLETIREFAAETLVGMGEAGVAHAAHAAYFGALAERAEPEIRGHNQRLWVTRLETEHDNMRAAFDWFEEEGGASGAVALAGALWRFWWACGHLSEGNRRIRTALRLGHEEGPERARALNGAANLAWSQGDLDGAEALHRECLALRDHLGDRPGIAISLNNLGIVAEQRHAYEAAVELYEQSLRVAREVDDTWIIGLVLGNLGGVLANMGQYGRAQSIGEESLAFWRERGDRVGEIRVLNNLAFLAAEQSDLARARILQTASLTLCTDLGNRENLAACLDGAARVVSERNPASSVRLWGAAEALRQSLGQVAPPVDEEILARCEQAVREALGDDRFTALRAEGAELDTNEAVREARAALAAL